MKNLQVGDIVTVKEPIEAYYSAYAGNPEMIIQPGMIGRVMATKVPNVSTKGHFNCIDFITPEVFQGNPVHNNNVWRIAAKDSQLTKVKNKVEI